MPKTKKVILFVVEGPTDETALALLFERAFSSDAVHFDIVGGDITTLEDWRGNPRERLRAQVKNHVDRQPYRWSDLTRIVQIVDLDGAYVPDSLVLQSAEGVLRYTEESIEAPNVEAITSRNANKRSALSVLKAIDGLTYSRVKVPYSVFFLSRNLEHALNGVVETVDSDEKERLARKFQLRYKNDIEGFKAFLNDVLAVPGNYRESWDYVSQGARSLQRGSNLHLVFEG